MHNFTLILGLVALYFAIILGFVVYARYKETQKLLPNLDEFFLAGKCLHPAVLSATFVASLFSTWSILGLPGMTYAQGVGALYLIYVLDILGLIALFWLGPKIRDYAHRHRVFSPVEIISAAYNSRVLGMYMAILFSIFLIPYIALQLVGVGSFIESYTGGQISYVWGVGSMMGIVLLYLLLGGMRAVAYTDLVQLAAIVIGMAGGLYYLLAHNNLAYIPLIRETWTGPSEILETPGPQGIWTWAMVLTAGIASLGIYFQPHLLTRAMMAEKPAHIKSMIVWTVGARIILSLLTIGFAAAMFKLMGAGQPANNMMGILFEMMAQAGTIGLILSGLMLMGALGAAMSTADSLLISIGQVATRDIIRPNFKFKPEHQILLSKGIMFAVLLGAFLAGLNPPKIMVDLGIYSGAACALLIPTITCFGWKRRSTLAAYVSITLGLAALLAAASYKFAYNEALFGVHPGFLPLVLSFIAYFAISFVTYDARKSK